MSTEANKALARRFYDEVLSQGKLDVVDDLVAEGFISHRANIPSGREGMKQFIAADLRALWNLHAIAEDVIAEDDRVVVRWTVTGDHHGALGDIAATGKHVRVTG